MVRYEVRVFIAIGYVYPRGWVFANHVSKYPFFDLTRAADFFCEKARCANYTAAIHLKAVKTCLVKIERFEAHVVQESMYEGEDVRGWYAAYHNTTTKTFSIDMILSDVGLYGAIQGCHGIETDEIAETIDELLYILGKDAPRYVILC